MTEVVHQTTSTWPLTKSAAQDPPSPKWKATWHLLALCPHNRVIAQDLDTPSTPPSPSVQGSNNKKLAFVTGERKGKHSKQLPELALNSQNPDGLSCGEGKTRRTGVGRDKRVSVWH